MGSRTAAPAARVMFGHIDWLNLRRVLQGQALMLILIALIVAFSLWSPYFLSLDNSLIIVGTASVLGIMAVTQTFLIISGGVDISAGSVVALSGVIVGLMVEAGQSVWLASAVAILAGALVGTVNGVIIMRLGVNALITTLGTLSIFSGLAYVISSAHTLVVPNPEFAFLGVGEIGRLPVPFIIFAVIFATGLFVERFTRAGRAIYAIGGNATAARLAGLRVKLIPFGLYVASGASAGLAGVITVSQLAAASPQVGQAYLLSVVTAVILGGCALTGGKGSLIGTLVAVFILGVLQNGFALLQLSSFVQTMALGVALIIAVLLDESTRSLAHRRGVA